MRLQLIFVSQSRARDAGYLSLETLHTTQPVVLQNPLTSSSRPVVFSSFSKPTDRCALYFMTATLTSSSKPIILFCCLDSWFPRFIRMHSGSITYTRHHGSQRLTNTTLNQHSLGRFCYAMLLARCKSTAQRTGLSNVARMLASHANGIGIAVENGKLARRACWPGSLGRLSPVAPCFTPPSVEGRV